MTAPRDDAESLRRVHTGQGYVSTLTPIDADTVRVVMCPVDAAPDPVAHTTVRRAFRSLPSRLVRVLVLGFILAGTAWPSSAVGSGRTTVPQRTLFDRVILTNKAITIGVKKFLRGQQVSFKIHNSGASPLFFEVSTQNNLSKLLTPSAQTAGVYKTKLLQPGDLATLAVNFNARGSYAYFSKTRNGKQEVAGTIRIQ